MIRKVDGRGLPFVHENPVAGPVTAPVKFAFMHIMGFAGEHRIPKRDRVTPRMPGGTNGRAADHDVFMGRHGKNLKLIHDSTRAVEYERLTGIYIVRVGGLQIVPDFGEQLIVRFPKMALPDFVYGIRVEPLHRFSPQWLERFYYMRF